jgi:hypothetical protein
MEKSQLSESGDTFRGLTSSKQALITAYVFRIGRTAGRCVRRVTSLASNSDTIVRGGTVIILAAATLMGGLTYYSRRSDESRNGMLTRRI